MFGAWAKQVSSVVGVRLVVVVPSVLIAEEVIDGVLHEVPQHLIKRFTKEAIVLTNDSSVVVVPSYWKGTVSATKSFRYRC
jgi:hypothetical protein